MHFQLLIHDYPSLVEYFPIICSRSCKMPTRKKLYQRGKNHKEDCGGVLPWSHLYGKLPCSKKCHFFINLSVTNFFLQISQRMALVSQKVCKRCHTAILWLKIATCHQAKFVISQKCHFLNRQISILCVIPQK